MVSDNSSEKKSRTATLPVLPDYVATSMGKMYSNLPDWEMKKNGTEIYRPGMFPLPLFEEGVEAIEVVSKYIDERIDIGNIRSAMDHLIMDIGKIYDCNETKPGSRLIERKLGIKLNITSNSYHDIFFADVENKTGSSIDKIILNNGKIWKKSDSDNMFINYYLDTISRNLEDAVPKLEKGFKIVPGNIENKEFRTIIETIESGDKKAIDAANKYIANAYILCKDIDILYDDLMRRGVINFHKKSLEEQDRILNKKFSLRRTGSIDDIKLRISKRYREAQSYDAETLVEMKRISSIDDKDKFS